MKIIDFSEVYNNLYLHIFTNYKTIDPENFTTSTVGVTGNGIIRERFIRQYLQLKDSDTNHFDGILESGRYCEIKTCCRTNPSDKGQMTFSLIEDRLSLYREKDPLFFFSDFTLNGKCIHICSVEYSSIRDKFESYYKKKELIKESKSGRNKYFIIPSGSWVDSAKLEFFSYDLVKDDSKSVFPGNSTFQKKLWEKFEELKSGCPKKYDSIVSF
jgi:hypothetical protein